MELSRVKQLNARVVCIKYPGFFPSLHPLFTTIHSFKSNVICGKTFIFAVQSSLQLKITTVNELRTHVKRRDKVPVKLWSDSCPIIIRLLVFSSVFCLLLLLLSSGLWVYLRSKQQWKKPFSCKRPSQILLQDLTW